MNNTGFTIFGTTVFAGIWYYLSRQPKIQVTNRTANSVSFRMSWDGEVIEDTVFANDEEQVITAGAGRWFISRADVDGATLTIAENLDPAKGTYTVVDSTFITFNQSSIGKDIKVKYPPTVWGFQKEQNGYGRWKVSIHLDDTVYSILTTDSVLIDELRSDDDDIVTKTKHRFAYDILFDNGFDDDEIKSFDFNIR